WCCTRRGGGGRARPAGQPPGGRRPARGALVRGRRAVGAAGVRLPADLASRDPGMRWLALTAYLIALAVPLHLSALVAAPAAIVLAAQRDDGVGAASA